MSSRCHSGVLRAARSFPGAPRPTLSVECSIVAIVVVACVVNRCCVLLLALHMEAGEPKKQRPASAGFEPTRDVGTQP